ncbi:MAG TPA: hypothetical protein EYO82_04970 [Gammaproteobacteria bacterium]|nr:hypothetical protein [Gammaproteobacteria bacterium]
MTARLYAALEWGNHVPLALMVYARVDSFTLTRLIQPWSLPGLSMSVQPIRHRLSSSQSLVGLLSYPLIVVL